MLLESAVKVWGRKQPPGPVCVCGGGRQVAGQASKEDQAKWGSPHPLKHTAHDRLVWDQAVSVLVGHCFMDFR